MSCALVGSAVVAAPASASVSTQVVPGVGVSLDGVACTSATTCEAVGYRSLAACTAIGAGECAPSGTSCTSRTADPVDCASGDLWHSFTDAEIPGRGHGLELTRMYNSSNASSEGIFGFGWSSTYDMHLIVNGDGSVTITEEDGSQVTATPTGGGSYSAPSWSDSTLTQNANGTWTFVRHQTETLTFSASGQLVGISDPNGYTTTLAYNASSQLATVTGSAGRQLTFSFGSNGLVSSVIDPLGRTTEYVYDSGGDLVSVTNPGRGTWSFTYGPGHLMLTMTDPDGGTVTNAYDSDGRVTSQTDPMGRTTTFAYSGENFSTAGGTTTITDPRGIVEIQDYVGGLLMSLTKATGTSSAATWSYTYDPVTLGRLSVTGPDGNTSRYTYDADGNVLTSTDPLGRTTTSTYNGLNEQVERGKVKVQEEIEIVGLRPEPFKRVVTGVEMFKKLLDEGQAGDNVGLLLRGTEKDDVERGMVLAKGGSITPHTKFTASAYVLTKEEGGRHTPFFNGYRPQFYFRTTDVTGVATLPTGTEMVMPGDNVTMEIELITPIAMEKGLRFAIREGGHTVGAGTVAEIIK